MKKLIFGPAGIPLSTLKVSTEEGVKQIKNLGLDAMEMGFVHGVRMKEEQAERVNKIREENNITLTAHAPYFVNLNAKEPEKKGASLHRIFQTAKIADVCGAYSITFHPAYYLGMEKEKVYKNVKEQMEKLMEQIEQEGIKVWIRPELTGKPTAFGDLWELIKLSQEFDQVLPCIDFSHMHARTNGKWNTYKEFKTILEEMEKGLGKTCLKNMHCHVSGIEYSIKGERNHLPLKESDFNFKDLMKALKEFNCAGVVICESPNLENDALLLKKTYEKA